MICLSPLKKSLPLLLVSILITSCKIDTAATRREIFLHHSAQNLEKSLEENKGQFRAVLDSYVKSLSDDQLISQLFLVNIEGNKDFYAVERQGALENKPREGDVLLPGGCLLFSYNIADTKEGLSQFLKNIRSYYIDHGIVPPYIAIDQEGGSVNRLRGVTSPLSSQQKIVENNDVSSAYQVYALQGEQMQELGIHLNLAPVVEVKTEENADFLDNRSFGSLDQVLDYGRACINAYENNGVGTVLKHFPGNSNTDPHTGLPEIRCDQKTLDGVFLEPFKKLISLDPAGILMSHARVALLDGQTPACLSKTWVTDVLRKNFGYDGLIFSDDIFMGALAENGFPPEVAAVSAIEAGVDCIMLSEKRFGSVGGVLLKKASQDPDFRKKIERAASRVIMFKIKAGILALSPSNDGSVIILPSDRN